MRKRIVVGVIVTIGLITWMVVSPPRFWLNLTKAVDLSNPVLTGRAVVAEYECRSCHQIEGVGALKGPSLDGITDQLDDVSIRLWLRNPKAIKGNTAMPNFHLSDSEIEAIVAYLESLEIEK